MVLAILLIGVLYYFQFNASRLITSIVQNAEQIAQSLKGWGYPLYAPGLGMTGNIVAFLVFVVMTAVLFGIAYYAVTKSFLKIALAKTVERQVAFRRSDIRSSKLSDTLLRRELKRFMASISYMMNAGLGLVFLVAIAVLSLIKMTDLRQILTAIGSQVFFVDSLAVVIAGCAIAVLTGLCMMASCSISMEGKYIWIYQAMPIDPYKISGVPVTDRIYRDVYHTDRIL